VITAEGALCTLVHILHVIIWYELQYFGPV
jgi:hypothetical protein